MRLSERIASALGVLTLVFSVCAADWVRPHLIQSFKSAKRREDHPLLPGPELTRLMSLGYRAAFADLIFGHVLVAYGQHFQERRRFDLAAHYLDAITTLDPKFREAYRLADTLITLQPIAPRPEDYRAARRLHERGLAQFPHDSELWLIAGQFSAYLASSHMPAAERDEWRLNGARKLARSCELLGSNENIPYHCITAASLFNEAGERQAARGFLERVLTTSDDPEIQGLAGGYIGKLVGQAERDRVEEHNKRFRALWRRDLTFVTRETLLLLGPRFDPARCAGLGNLAEPGCATSFRGWSALQP